MPAFGVPAIIRSIPALLIGACLPLGATPPAEANVIADWDVKAVAVAAPGAPGQRELAIVHIAMFDAVNSIERRYRPYVVQLATSKATSQEAAAATAAGTVLAGLHPETAAETKAALCSYLATIPDGESKSDGIKLGEAVAAKVLQVRQNDGANTPDAYRPRTTAGVYVTTPITVASMWPAMMPFALTKPSQFRPPPPIPLASPEWTADYNELKDYGGKTSVKRSAQQTETARFWLMVGAPAYHPIPRQLVVAKQMSIIDSARFMALFAVALTDAYIAVFDAKYHYEFWRPITAIRNGDIDDNPATEREATWQADRQYAAAPGIPVRALYQQRSRRSRHRIRARFRRHPRCFDDQLNRARSHPPLEQPRHLRRRGCERPHLGRVPLPFLDPRRDRYGTQDRTIRRAKRDAASELAWFEMKLASMSPFARITGW
jgi:hypothetical protein